MQLGRGEQEAGGSEHGCDSPVKPTRTVRLMLTTHKEQLHSLLLWFRIPLPCSSSLPAASFVRHLLSRTPRPFPAAPRHLL